MKKNVAGQMVDFQLIDAASGSFFTGSAQVEVKGDNAGAYAVGGGTLTALGKGCFQYAPTQAETNFNHVAFRACEADADTGTGIDAIPVVIQFDTTPDLDLLEHVHTILEKLDGMISGDTGTGSTTYEFTGQALSNVRSIVQPLIQYLLTHGDVAWATATGFATSAQATTIQSVTDKLDTMIATDTGTGGTSYEFTGEALDSVFDVAISQHLLSGSIGAAINAAGSAGDPWSTAQPGSYGAGTFGALVVAIAGYLDTEVAAIKATTDKLDTMMSSNDTGTGAGAYEFTGQALTNVRGIVQPLVQYVVGHGDAAWATSTLTAAQVNAEVVDALSTDANVDGKTIEQALEYIAAACAGKVSGAGTGTEVFKGFDGSTTRLTVTVDSSGNRSAVTYG